MKKEEIDAVINHISVNVVERIEVDMDKVLRNDYESSHVDFAVAIVRAHYRGYVANINAVFLREHPGEEPPDLTRALKHRALLYAKFGAHTWLIQHAHDLVDRSTTWLLDEAERTGWYRTDYFTWDKLSEMLADIIDAQTEGATQAYDWNTIATKILPAARQFGISPGLLLAATGQVGKLREMAPAYNELEQRMQAGHVTVEEGKERLEWMLTMAADRKISRAQMKEQLNVWRGRVVESIEPLAGWKIIVPSGDHLEEVFVIPTDGAQITSRMIENGLRNRVTFTAIGLEGGLRLMTDLIKSKRKEENNE